MSPRRAALPQNAAIAANDGIHLSARLATSRILPGAQSQDLAITIAAPPSVSAHDRPPLSIAIVIDRSGSMRGAPIEHAKAAAISVLGQLEPRDAFAVVTYSSGSEVVLPIQRATEANKARARAAIETIVDGGGTCTSCGISEGAGAVGASPVDRGVRRVLLISDGQANEGISDRGELAQHAAIVAARGVSISTVGVGLDFDETTMRRLAEVGRGNYYFIEDSVALSAMFASELGELRKTIASDAELVVTAPAGTHIDEVLGYPMTRTANGVIIPIADLRAAETRKVVLRVTLDSAPEGARAVAEAELAWHRVDDGARRVASSRAEVDVVRDPREVEASLDVPTLRAIEAARSARALEEAAAAYDADGIGGARRVLERRAQALRANAKRLGAATVQQLEAASSEALDGFAKAPAKAKKETSVKAYKLAR